MGTAPACSGHDVTHNAANDCDEGKDIDGVPMTEGEGRCADADGYISLATVRLDARCPSHDPGDRVVVDRPCRAVLVPGRRRAPQAHEHDSEVRSRVPVHEDRVRHRVHLRGRRDCVRLRSVDECSRHDAGQEDTGENDGESERYSEDDEADDLMPGSIAGADYKVELALVLHIFETSLFSWSCASESRVKGAFIRGAPLASQRFGNLIDDYAWGVLVKAGEHDEVEAIVITPPSSTYLDKGDGLVPALRGEGSYWRGLPEAKEFKAMLRQEACCGSGRLEC